MNWYIAKIVFQIISGKGEHTAQFDEQLRLIEAADEQEAFVKAQKIGLLDEDSFLNDQQQLVQWKYIDIAELQKLNGLTSGIELYSRIYEADDADNYIQMIRRKADRLQGDHILRSLELIS